LSPCNSDDSTALFVFSDPSKDCLTTKRAGGGDVPRRTNDTFFALTMWRSGAAVDYGATCPPIVADVGTALAAPNDASGCATRAGHTHKPPGCDSVDGPPTHKGAPRVELLQRQLVGGDLGGGERVARP